MRDLYNVYAFLFYIYTCVGFFFPFFLSWDSLLLFCLTMGGGRTQEGRGPVNFKVKLSIKLNKENEREDIKVKQ